MGSSAAGSPASGQLQQRAYDGTTLGTEAALADTSDWSQVRGVISGTDRTYRILSNGTFQRSPDGAAWTPWSSWLTLSNVRGAAYAADADWAGPAALPHQQRQQPLRPRLHASRTG